MILPGFPLSGTVHLAEVVGSTISARGERRLCNNDVDREGQQQVLRATFPGILTEFENSRVRMDALARKSHETHDMKVKDEIERLLKEYDKLKEPWLFVSR